MKRHFLLSSVLIILGSLGAVVAVIGWGKIPEVNCLLILSAGLACKRAISIHDVDVKEVQRLAGID